MKSTKILTWLVVGFLVLGGLLYLALDKQNKEAGFVVASFALFPFIGLIVALVIKSFKE